MTRDTAERARELLNEYHWKHVHPSEVEANRGPKGCMRCDELLPLLTKIQAEAQERLAAWMTEHSFSTGHGDTFEDLLKELDWQVKELRQKVGEARLEEAKWWREQTHEGAICSPQDCTQCARIAALAQALQTATSSQPEEKEGK